jgi:hypothetical protein
MIVHPLRITNQRYYSERKKEMTSLTDTQKHLMDLIASVLFLKPLECPEDVDWALLCKEAHAQAVLPLAFSAAKQWIPKEEQTGWKCLSDHMTSEGIGIRHLCDWLVFADHFTDEEFTDIFEEKLKADGLWNFAQLLTLCGIRYLGCPPKEWAGEAKEELLEALICDICNGGNFGKKDADRYQQIKYISNRGERTVDDKGVFQQLLNTLYKKTRSECAFVKKIPVLLPIGMVCTALQYLMLVLRGERSMDQKATLEKAAWRKGIYKEFGLFEPEKGLERVK